MTTINSIVAVESEAQEQGFRFPFSPVHVKRTVVKGNSAPLINTGRIGFLNMTCKRGTSHSSGLMCRACEKKKEIRKVYKDRHVAKKKAQAVLIANTDVDASLKEVNDILDKINTRK